MEDETIAILSVSIFVVGVLIGVGIEHNYISTNSEKLQQVNFTRNLVTYTQVEQQKTGASSHTDLFIISPAGAISQNGKTILYNNIATKGIGTVPIYNATSQKTETTTADPNIVTYTPPASAGTYRISYVASVASASSGVISFTVSYTDSQGTAKSNLAMPLFQQGTAAPNTTFTTSAAGEYSGDFLIDVNNAQAKIIVKWVGGGTSSEKVSSTIEQLQ